MERLRGRNIGIIIGGIAAAAAMAGVLAFLVSERPNQEEFVFKDVEFEVKDITITNINEDESKLTITFSLKNPNPGTIVLEVINYQIFANGVRVAADSVGERITGALVGSTGGTFYLIPGVVNDISDEVTIKKTSSIEELWNDLQNDNVKWRVKGIYVITEPQREAGKEYEFDVNL